MSFSWFFSFYRHVRFSRDPTPTSTAQDTKKVRNDRHWSKKIQFNRLRSSSVVISVLFSLVDPDRRSCFWIQSLLVVLSRLFQFNRHWSPTVIFSLVFRSHHFSLVLPDRTFQFSLLYRPQSSFSIQSSLVAPSRPHWGLLSRVFSLVVSAELRL